MITLPCLIGMIHDHILLWESLSDRGIFVAQMVSAVRIPGLSWGVQSTSLRGSGVLTRGVEDS